MLRIIITTYLPVTTQYVCAHSFQGLGSFWPRPPADPCPMTHHIFSNIELCACIHAHEDTSPRDVDFKYKILIARLHRQPQFSLYIFYMQGSRSLFQTGIKLQGQSAPTGITKSRPFLNVWSNLGQLENTSAPQQQQHTMASATSFFKFTPKDSTFE